MLHRGSNCSLARAMDGRIMWCGIISSCQSAATSEIVKRTWACVYRGAALYQAPDLYLLPLPFCHTGIIVTEGIVSGFCRAWFVRHSCVSSPLLRYTLLTYDVIADVYRSANGQRKRPCIWINFAMSRANMTHADGNRVTWHEIVQSTVERIAETITNRCPSYTV